MSAYNSASPTPYESSSYEKPYYDVDSAPITPNQNTNYNTNSQVNNNYTNNVYNPKTDDDLEDHRKRLIFAYILLIICISDIIMQIFLHYFNYYLLSDDIAILILLIYFFFNYIVKKRVSVKNICIALFFVLVWLGGFICRFMGYSYILDSNNKTWIKVIVLIIYTIFIFLRVFGLMITFRD